MMKNIFYIIFAQIFVFVFSLEAMAGMGSENYRIPTSVLSGGGGFINTQTYQTNSTLGQPSTLMNQEYPPYSNNYELYPGFWYTIFIEASCPCDVNGDGQVTPQDALCAFQKYLGICPTACGPCEEICCDVNGDADCTPQDALEIFREYLGIYPNVCSPE